MTGTVRLIDRERRAIFGFVAGLPDEQQWYNSLEKSCGALIEFTRLDVEKLAALGVTGQEGLWIGIKVTNAEVWKQITSGAISKFDVHVGDRVEIEFVGAVRDKIDKEADMPFQDDAFVISKSHPAHALISKCVAAVKKGDLGGLSRADFDRALSEVAKAYAEESDQEFHAAYAEILTTPCGADLYSGYCSAPVESGEGVRKGDADGGPAWREVERRAREVLKVNGNLYPTAVELAGATADIMRRDPELAIEAVMERVEVVDG